MADNDEAILTVEQYEVIGNLLTNTFRAIIEIAYEYFAIYPCLKCDGYEYTITQMSAANVRSIQIECLNCHKSYWVKVKPSQKNKFSQLENEFKLLIANMRQYIDQMSHQRINRPSRLKPASDYYSNKIIVKEEDRLIFENSKNNRQVVPPDVRDAVWRRDGGHCANCGSNENLEFDHIIPVSKGGATTYRNIQLLCEKCNGAKGDNIG